MTASIVYFAYRKDYSFVTDLAAVAFSSGRVTTREGWLREVAGKGSGRSDRSP